MEASAATHPPEVQADVDALDKACEEVASCLSRCAEHVNAGRLEADVMMLKVHQLAARLMGPGA